MAKRFRIMTRAQRLAHVERCATKGYTPGHRELLGDLASVNSNQVHNRETGYNEFYRDTPAWVVRVAQKRGWIDTVGLLEAE